MGEQFDKKWKAKERASDDQRHALVRDLVGTLSQAENDEMRLRLRSIAGDRVGNIIGLVFSDAMSSIHLELMEIKQDDH